MTKTTKQVRKAPNPSGKGGFAEHPENRSDGRWSSENSFTYWLNLFKAMSVEEFTKWEKKTPQSKRSVASSLAYARIANARTDLREFNTVADRTEGRPIQAVELTGANGSQFMPDNEENTLVDIANDLKELLGKPDVQSDSTRTSQENS